MGWGTSLWMNWKQKKRRDRSHAKSSPFRELLQILFYGNSATAQALHDLDEVWDYISFELQNPQAAEKTVNRILDKVDQLVEFAQSGALLSAVSEVMGEERFLVCDSYMIFYHSEKQEVMIDRVLYGRRDYLRVLFDKTELPEQKGS